MLRQTHIDPKVQKHIHEISMSRLTPAQRKLWEQTNQMEPTVSALCGTPDSALLIEMMAKMIRARRCVEIGCLTGFKTVSLALAVPADGQVITCDITDKHLTPVRGLWKEAGVDHKISVRTGDAQTTIEKMLTEGETGKIDLVLIDGDQRNVMTHFERAMRLCRPGGLIIVESTLWRGTVVTDQTQDEETRAMKELSRMLRDDKRVDMVMLGISDGLTICMKRDENNRQFV